MKNEQITYRLFLFLLSKNIIFFKKLYKEDFEIPNSYKMQKIFVENDFKMCKNGPINQGLKYYLFVKNFEPTEKFNSVVNANVHIFNFEKIFNFLNNENIISELNNIKLKLIIEINILIKYFLYTPFKTIMKKTIKFINSQKQIKKNFL